MKHFAIPANKLTITPNAVDIYKGEFTDIKKKYALSKYLLFVSRLEPRKNHYLMLKTFVDLELYKQGYDLIFIGRINDVKTEKYHNYFEQQNEEVKMRVKHIENISYEELNGFYKNADLFVYPSVAEGFGIPPLEAAVIGCKVLCSNKTAMADFDFFGQYLFDPDHEEELKAKIITTLNDKNYPFEAIKNAVIEKYDWLTIAANFGEKLKSIY